MKSARGALIVLEGCDRTGKTTQSKLLLESLQKLGKKVELWRFPERSTYIGKVLDDYLKCQVEMEDHAAHLLFSANRWECVPKMIETLKTGTSLIVDRYAYSGVAFSAAKQNMSLDWCKYSDVGLPKPDLVIYLDMNLEAIKDRQDFGKERYESLNFQSKVRENYSLMKDTNWKVFQANKQIENIHEEIKNIVLQTIDNTLSLVPEKLWSDDKLQYSL